MPQLNPTPEVSLRFGAPMGRASFTPAIEPPVKFYLRRIPLDSGGYDAGGAYWGLGSPLYWASSTCGKADYFFRATDRLAAKAQVLSDYPAATFYR